MSRYVTIEIEVTDDVTRDDIEAAVEEIYCGCVPSLPSKHINDVSLGSLEED